LRSGGIETGTAEDILKRWLGAVETVKRERGLALLV
jgi:hypothetical protein